jgi:DNA-binding beta-propeller fold protein YncE
MKKALVLVLLVACGDGNSHTTPDAAVTTDSSPTADAPVPTPRAIVLGADFSSNTGVVSKLDVTSLQMQSNVVASAATSDPVIRHIGTNLYVINRSVGENVTVLDANTLAVVGQYSTGAGSNPQDVAVVGNKLYVPANGTAGVVVLDNGTVSKTIALDTAVGDPDGKPDCNAAYAVGADVYVTCDLLDASFSPRGPGKLVVIDSATDTVRTTIALPDKNPQGPLIKTPQSSAFGGDLLVSLVPAFDTYTSGCIARITPGMTPTATCATGLNNSDLAGFANGISIGDAMYVTVVVDQNFSTVSAQLRKVDLATGMLASAPISGSSEQITDVATCPDGSIVTADATMNAAGVRVFKTGSERTTSAIPIGLPPIFSGGIVCYDAP